MKFNLYKHTWDIRAGTKIWADAIVICKWVWCYWLVFFHTSRQDQFHPLPQLAKFIYPEWWPKPSFMGIQDTELNLLLHFITRAVQEGTTKASSGFQILHAIMLAVTLFFPLDFFISAITLLTETIPHTNTKHLFLHICPIAWQV